MTRGSEIWTRRGQEILLLQVAMAGGTQWAAGGSRGRLHFKPGAQVGSTLRGRRAQLGSPLLSGLLSVGLWGLSRWPSYPGSRISHLAAQGSKGDYSLTLDVEVANLKPEPGHWHHITPDTFY